MTRRRIIWIAFWVGWANGRAAQILWQSGLVATGAVMMLLLLWVAVLAGRAGWL